MSNFVGILLNVSAFFFSIIPNVLINIHNLSKLNYFHVDRQGKGSLSPQQLGTIFITL